MPPGDAGHSFKPLGIKMKIPPSAACWQRRKHTTSLLRSSNKHFLFLYQIRVVRKPHKIAVKMHDGVVLTAEQVLTRDTKAFTAQT